MLVHNVLVGGGEGGGVGQFQASENVTKTQSTTLKTLSLKVIFIHFSDTNQHLRSQCTKLFYEAFLPIT